MLEYSSMNIIKVIMDIIMIMIRIEIKIYKNK